MRVIADLHIHSPYSRAVSQEMSIPNLDAWGVKKGINLLGTGDFTHAKWLDHLRENLEPAEPGLYKRKKSSSGVRFMFTAEISSIYSHNGQVRRVHNLIFAPSLEVVEDINTALSAKGAKLQSDGRPIVGLSSRELLNIALNASPECLFVPAHAWTPWFAVFGSKSGYNSLEECFGEDAKYIYAIETGLSSDIEMNRRISALDNITLISNSDPHSLRRLGRECNVFEIEKNKLSYGEIYRIIKERDARHFLFTVEYFPEEGRYHYDGHREHNVSLHPRVADKLNKICPECGRPLTVGVLSRVEELADRPETKLPEGFIPGRRTVQLEEIIADSLGLKSPTGKKVVEVYEAMVRNYPGGELGILLEAEKSEISDIGGPLIAEGIERVRAGQVKIIPGFDGVYGKVEIFSDEERNAFAGLKAQKTLF
ncbi:MAG: hypothetical protein A3J48_01125 [Candidatus Doudnabacteria bacterium RIFCSPHIGHO2_02_FULL_46_11]|uniref:DNA helicase UvrD n=1 Tax=Candidatus Doudnabacteria bacterium RIFCSPHIGHO2_02_FULL_46_11 TaxID=1817832 RepID=A0A1F5P7S1_9BACT|nr:MAG: hypothetical protein A3J48_01125 [Candidatus Doudnabacteria bacterium RIFCSPHIGHO2_02_FULL_46_11]